MPKQDDTIFTDAKKRKKMLNKTRTTLCERLVKHQYGKGPLKVYSNREKHVKQREEQLAKFSGEVAARKAKGRLTTRQAEKDAEALERETLEVRKLRHECLRDKETQERVGEDMR